ncbi:MAG: hypothetical protein EAX96_17150 [Candidatus Lokiarchaeota archaeon]|nr:hypothetical protein [Candidatus Lokiarchaeota archaeon]
MPKPKRLHLGWLQQTILSMLWNKEREMYGLEIQRELNFIGEKLGAGQLYPALKSLEEMKAITSREEERKGANRKLYRITERGRFLIYQSLTGLFIILEKISNKIYSFIFNEVPKLVDVKKDMLIVDFTFLHMEEERFKLAKLLGPKGQYYIISTEKRYSDYFKELIEFENLQDLISVVKRRNYIVNLPDNFADLGLVFFTMHEDDSDWIIPEMKRILKPNGKGIIIDVQGLNGHIIETMLLELIPRHSKIGINLNELFPMLDEYNLEIINQKEEKGVIFIIIKK